MSCNKDVRSSIPAPPPPIAFAVLCGVPAQALPIQQALEDAGLRLALPADVCILIDAPQGFALHHLELSAAPASRTIVLTNNLCPEYWEDIREHRIAGVLEGTGPTAQIVEAVMRIGRGEPYRALPERATVLTTTERRLLHLLAHGQSNQLIAQHLQIQSQSVRNTLATVYEKLNLSSRSEAILYYWGIQQELMCPPHLKRLDGRDP